MTNSSTKVHDTGSQHQNSQTGDGASHQRSSNLFPGIEWDEFRAILLKIHDLASEAQPSIEDVKSRHLQIAAYLALGYREIRANPKLDVEFTKFLEKNVPGRDPIRRFVKFVLQEAYSKHGASIKGLYDTIVAAVHVTTRNYLCEPSNDFSVLGVQNFIGAQVSSNGRLRGLDACWAIFMDLQRVEARDHRAREVAKQNLWEQDQQRRRDVSDREEAAALGLNLAAYREKMAEEGKEKAEVAKAAAVVAFLRRLAQKSKAVTDLGSLNENQMLIVDARGRLRILSTTHVEELILGKVTADHRA